MWSITIQLGSSVHQGSGETPLDAYAAIPDWGRRDPNIQMGYGAWVRDAAAKIAADPAISRLEDVNKYNPDHRAILIRDHT